MKRGAGAALLLALALGASADDATTTERAMMEGRAGWSTTALFTVGESIDGYRPPGKLDRIGAYVLASDTVRVLVNHELSEDKGYPYSLANGTALRGARVSYVDVDRRTREVCGAGLAYSTIYDRSGRVVTEPRQVNEGFSPIDGISRLCSPRLVRAGERGFVDDVYLCGEEVSEDDGHPHGGSEWALDVEAGELWACPQLGRGKWENVTPIETGSDRHVALLLGDDRTGAPLWLWIGKKKSKGGFLQRNGLDR